MTTPTLSRNIVISVVLALAAAVALVLYTNQVQDSAKSSGDAVRVVVVTHDIKAGTAVYLGSCDGDLAYRTVRRSDLVPGAYTDLNAARGLVLTQPVFHGDQLTASRTGLAHDQSVSPPDHREPARLPAARRRQLRDDRRHPRRRPRGRARKLRDPRRTRS